MSDTARKIYALFRAEVNAQKATFEILQTHGRIPKIEEAAKNGFIGDGIQDGTHPDAVPADFLINETGSLYMLITEPMLPIIFRWMWWRHLR